MGKPNTDTDDVISVPVPTGGNAKKAMKQVESHGSYGSNGRLIALGFIIAIALISYGYISTHPTSQASISTSEAQTKLQTNNGQTTPSQAQNTGQETTKTSFETYKTKYESLRGMSTANVKNPYALIPIENTGKTKLPLAYAVYSSTAVTTASITNIEIGKDKIAITVENGKNLQGQNVQVQGLPLTVILLTKDYQAAIIANTLPASKLRPSEAIPEKEIHVIQGTTNNGKTIEELIPQLQYIVIAVKE